MFKCQKLQGGESNPDSGALALSLSGVYDLAVRTLLDDPAMFALVAEVPGQGE